jgi:Tol biopolymer transport system component
MDGSHEREDSGDGAAPAADGGAAGSSGHARRRLTLAKAAGIAATLVAVVGLGVLAWGCGNGGDDPIGALQVNAAPLSAQSCLERPKDQPTQTPGLGAPGYIQSAVWTHDLDERVEQMIVLGSSPNWSPDGRWLAFNDGTFDGLHFRGSLCAIATDFSTVKQLAPVFRGDVAPICAGNSGVDWSRDRDSLVYEGREDLMYTISAGGGSSSNLALTQGLGPAWSPDGTKVAFTWPIEGGAGGCGVWVVYEDDRDRHEQLTVGEYPAFSPDGRRLAFTRNDQLLISDSDGDNVTVVVDVAPEEDQIEGPRGLTWSSDGTRIAYQYDSPGGDWGHVFVVEARPGAKPVDIGEGRSMSWSPDGKSIAITRLEGDGNCTVYIAASSGKGEPERLTSGCGADWSPDGRYIAFFR